MALHTQTRINANSSKTNNVTKEEHLIRILQLNMQHSRAATQNVNEIAIRNGIDILLLQEPYNFNNKICGLSKHMQIFSKGEKKKRAAIIVTNKNYNVILLNQFSNEDMVAVIVQIRNIDILIISAYFDITIDIQINLV